MHIKQLAFGVNLPAGISGLNSLLAPGEFCLFIQRVNSAGGVLANNCFGVQSLVRGNF